MSFIQCTYVYLFLTLVFIYKVQNIFYRETFKFKTCAKDVRQRYSPRVFLRRYMERDAKERVVFSEDGAKLAVCGLDGEVKVWSSATGTLTTRFTPEGARGVAIAAATWSRVSVKMSSV